MSLTDVTGKPQSRIIAKQSKNCAVVNNGYMSNARWRRQTVDSDTVKEVALLAIIRAYLPVENLTLTLLPCPLVAVDKSQTLFIPKASKKFKLLLAYLVYVKRFITL